MQFSAEYTHAEGRRSVKAETCEHAGEGAKRVADYLIGKYEELTAEGADEDR